VNRLASAANRDLDIVNIVMPGSIANLQGTRTNDVRFPNIQVYVWLYFLPFALLAQIHDRDTADPDRPTGRETGPVKPKSPPFDPRKASANG